MLIDNLNNKLGIRKNDSTKEKLAMNENKVATTEDDAEVEGMLGNPFTRIILITALFLISVGCIMTFSQNWWGIIVGGFGAGILAFGYTQHSPSDPKEVGVLTLWGKPLPRHSVISGDVILLPYFPFNFTTIKIDVSNADTQFGGKGFIFLTKDKVPMVIEISITARPNIHDLRDYIQAGADMKKVYSQIREIVYRQVQIKVREMESIVVKTQGEDIGIEIKKALEAGDFGIEIKKVQVVASLPPAIEDSMVDAKREEYQRTAESADYHTIHIAAIRMQENAARQYIISFDSLPREVQVQKIMDLIKQKVILDLDGYEKKVREMKLIRDGKTAGIFTGDTSDKKSIIVANIGGDK